jgi:DNA-directed RNA polymerase subunit RPC12/RpoP
MALQIANVLWQIVTGFNADIQRSLDFRAKVINTATLMIQIAVKKPVLLCNHCGSKLIKKLRKNRKMMLIHKARM